MKDLAATKMKDRADVEILDPVTTEGMGAFFILAGPNHPTRRAFELARDRKMRLEIKKKGRIDLGDPEEDRRQEIDYLAQCTLGWYSVDAETGERKETILIGSEIPFSVDAAKKLFNDPELAWIKTQIRADLKSDEVFLKGSSPSSSAGPSGISG